jgi:hypothetical protein
MESTQGIPIYLKILQATKDGDTRRSSLVSTNPKTRRNLSLTTGRHSIGGALPPGAFSAQNTRQPRRIVSIRTNLCLGS